MAKRDPNRQEVLVDQAARALDGLSGAAISRVPTTRLHRADRRPPRLRAREDPFYAALETAGLGYLREKPDPFSFRDLRHTYGTLAVQIYPISDVQAYIGHEQIGTTMCYVHHVPKTDAAAKGTAFIAAQLETVSPLCPEAAHSDTTESNSQQPISA